MSALESNPLLSHVRLFVTPWIVARQAFLSFPMQVARGPPGIPLLSMPGPKILCGVSAGTEDSTPVLTWILGYFWSLPRGVSPRFEWGHARALSSRAVAAVSHFT